MSYTPVELRHVQVGRRLLGYDRSVVEQILSDVADSFETVWRDRGELADRVEQLEEKLGELKRREQALTNALVAAEHAADELKERARREADLIVAEAHGEARSVTRAAQGERERLLAEVRRIEALLRSALGLVVEVGVASVPDEEPVPAPATAAKGADARDFRPVPPTAPTEPGEPEVAATPEEKGDQAAAAEDTETPGWPPLRKVAQGGADFDWGD